MVRVLLDTDIGSDVDDALALCFALRCPEIKLAGITTVYGDVHLRAKIARKLLLLGNQPEVPVAAGIAQPLLREREVFVMGHEGKGIVRADEPNLEPIAEHAVDFLIRMIMNNPGELVLAAIGPLTNIATAIIRQPEIVRRLKEIIFIGGVARLCDNALEVPALEWNVRADPEAARIVFTSGVPVTMLGMDVTRREATRLHGQHLERIAKVGTPLTDAAARLIEIYWEYAEPAMRCIHDVVALAFILDRRLVRTQRLRVDIETRGLHTTGFTLVYIDEQRANVDVAIEIMEPDLLDLFLERICRK
jgi:purine nucleosidase